ncbi:very short patch repair endonuclease [Novacetimonas hansenii]|uniref:very short patch repair endonuclease n=1 Tax=Novacetimonas hansenii TaxID=436 RepID=UPI0039E7F356
MSRVRGKNTTPEMRTRQCAHAMGLRFRLHREDLPGKPNLVFPKHRLVVFVHGCFWHRHPQCSKASFPKSRTECWQAKFDANITRDSRVAQKLETMAWRVKIV